MPVRGCPSAAPGALTCQKPAAPHFNLQLALANFQRFTTQRACLSAVLVAGCWLLGAGALQGLAEAETRCSSEII